MAAITQPVPVVERISYEEFLTAYNGIRAEWVDGEVIMPPPASYPHQELVSVQLLALSSQL
jgi:hypothetical protein